MGFCGELYLRERSMARALGGRVHYTVQPCSLHSSSCTASAVELRALSFSVLLPHTHTFQPLCLQNIWQGSELYSHSVFFFFVFCLVCFGFTCNPENVGTFLHNNSELFFILALFSYYRLFLSAAGPVFSFKGIRLNIRLLLKV